MANQIAIPWTRRSLFWGYACGLVALARAASYTIIPPEPGSLSSRTFENILPYYDWAIILFVLSAVVIGGTAFQMARVSYAGHLGIFFCYLVFAYSSITGIVEWFGQDQPLRHGWLIVFTIPLSVAQFLGIEENMLVLLQGWTGISPLIVVAMVNGERCLNLGAIIRLELSAKTLRKLDSEDKNE